jgi:hypothetical protein
MSMGSGDERKVGRPVIPPSGGWGRGAGGSSVHERKINHAVATTSTGGATTAGQRGRRFAAMTAASSAGSHASRPPGTFDQ